MSLNWLTFKIHPYFSKLASYLKIELSAFNWFNCETSMSLNLSDLSWIHLIHKQGLGLNTNLYVFTVLNFNMVFIS